MGIMKQLALRQALCDRQNVNRAFSQIGFVQFLAAPLTFAVAKILPPTESLAKQVLGPQSQNSRDALRCFFHFKGLRVLFLFSCFLGVLTIMSEADDLARREH